MIRLNAHGYNSCGFKNPNLPWQVSGFLDCHGQATEVSECPRLPLCKGVTRVDRILDGWSGWDLCETCTGLRECKRHILTANNEWGGTIRGQLDRNHKQLPNDDVDCKR